MKSLKEHRNAKENEFIEEQAQKVGVEIVSKQKENPTPFFVIWLATVVAVFALSIFIIKSFFLVYVINIVFIVVFIIKYHTNITKKISGRSR